MIGSNTTNHSRMNAQHSIKPLKEIKHLEERKKLAAESELKNNQLKNICSEMKCVVLDTIDEVNENEFEMSDIYSCTEKVCKKEELEIDKPKIVKRKVLNFIKKSKQW